MLMLEQKPGKLAGIPGARVRGHRDQGVARPVDTTVAARCRKDVDAIVSGII